MTMPADEYQAVALDAADPLAPMRERFVIDDPELRKWMNKLNGRTT